LNIVIPAKQTSGKNVAGSNAVLNSIRNGPVKANAKTSIKPVQHKGEVVVPSLNPKTAIQSSSGSATQKQKQQVNKRKQRPASPGIRGKVAEGPYKAYAKTLKSNANI